MGLLQAYALVATGVRIIATHASSGTGGGAGGGARATVVSTQGAPSVRDNVVAVFGAKAAEGLEPLPAGDAANAIPGLPAGASIAGWVSRAAAPGRAGGDRQFFFVNGRPVDLPKAAKVLNEAFRALSSPAAAAAKPTAVIDIRCGSWGSRGAA